MLLLMPALTAVMAHRALTGPKPAGFTGHLLAGYSSHAMPAYGWLAGLQHQLQARLRWPGPSGRLALLPIVIIFIIIVNIF